MPGDFLDGETPAFFPMLAARDVAFPREDDIGGSQDIPVKTHDTDAETTTHERDKKESLSVTLTLLASGFGLISDGCDFLFSMLANEPAEQPMFQIKTT